MRLDTEFGFGCNRFGFGFNIFRNNYVGNLIASGTNQMMMMRKLRGFVSGSSI